MTLEKDPDTYHFHAYYNGFIYTSHQWSEKITLKFGVFQYSYK